MLQDITIKNYAIAEHIHIEFNEKINLITGETGAGKSLIINALNVVLGGRAYAESVRSDKEKATVTAVFDISRNKAVKHLLARFEFEESDTLILRRDIFAKGNSKAFINEIPVSVNTLKSIGDLLLDIHGQHEHQYLLQDFRHLDYLDKLSDNSASLDTMAKLYEDFVSSASAYKEIRDNRNKIIQEQDYMRFQLEELRKASLKEGEEEELEVERKKMQNAEKIAQACNKTDILINESDINIRSILAEIRREVETLSQYDEQFNNHLEELERVEIIMEEVSRSVQEFGSGIEFSPALQEEIEGRLSELNRLEKKYGKDINDLIAYRDSLAEKMDKFENLDKLLEEKESQYLQCKEKYWQHAEKLHRERLETAKKFASLLLQELSELGMKHAGFKAEVELQENKEENYTARGADKVRFLISANPGEELKPLAKIASGGEISRIMLAIKKVFAEKDGIPSLVFDEIDSGVSGDMAMAIGEKITALAENHQILCITHLPQIASLPGKHFKVGKKVAEGRTFTYITPLSETERIEEIAELIGGKSRDKNVINSAEFLLNRY